MISIISFWFAILKLKTITLLKGLLQLLEEFAQQTVNFVDLFIVCQRWILKPNLLSAFHQHKICLLIVAGQPVMTKMIMTTFTFERKLKKKSEFVF